MPKPSGKPKKEKEFFSAIVYLVKDGTIKYKTADVYALYLARRSMLMEEEEPVVLSENGCSSIERIEDKVHKLREWLFKEKDYNQVWQIKRLEARIKKLEDCLSSFKKPNEFYDDGYHGT